MQVGHLLARFEHSRHITICPHGLRRISTPPQHKRHSTEGAVVGSELNRCGWGDFSGGNDKDGFKCFCCVSFWVVCGDSLSEVGVTPDANGGTLLGVSICTDPALRNEP